MVGMRTLPNNHAAAGTCSPAGLKPCLIQSCCHCRRTPKSPTGPS